MCDADAALAEECPPVGKGDWGAAEARREFINELVSPAVRQAPPGTPNTTDSELKGRAFL